MFCGLITNISLPIGESEYEFKPGNSYALILSAIFGTNFKSKLLPMGISTGLMFLRTDKSYWSDIEAPNSESVAIAPVIGAMWNTSYGAISLNIRKPFLIDGASAGLADNIDVNNTADMIEISIGYRNTLKYVIPWLYF
jgi:hypothetical protein